MYMGKEKRLKTLEELDRYSTPSIDECKSIEDLLTYYSTKSGFLMGVAEGFLTSIQSSLKFTKSEEVRRELQRILDSNSYCLTDKE